MKSLNKLASLLDKNGNYLLADKLDKIAQQNNYVQLIKTYKQYVIDRDVQGASNYYNSVLPNLVGAQKQSFIDQAMRIRLHYKFGEYADANKYRTISEGRVNKFINNFGLNNPNLTKTQFDALWKKMMTVVGNRVWSSDNTNLSDNEGFKRQMQLTYNILTAKFRN